MDYNKESNIGCNLYQYYRHDVENIENKEKIKEENQIELIKRIKLGDKSAENELIEKNLRLVIFVARKFINQGIEFEDLIQEGNLALVKYAKSFDPQKGKFSTYAVSSIIGYIKKLIIRQQSLLHVSSGMQLLINKYKKVVNKFNNIGYEPTIEDIAKEMKLPIKKVEELSKINTTVISLDTLIDDEMGDTVLMEVIKDKDDAVGCFIDKRDNEDYINYLLHNSNLTEKEIEVIKLRHGFTNNKTMTLETIGQIFGVSGERIRKIEVEALRKLRTVAITGQKQSTKTKKENAIQKIKK